MKGDIEKIGKCDSFLPDVTCTADAHWMDVATGKKYCDGCKKLHDEWLKKKQTG
jgi:hypothetical protein